MLGMSAPGPQPPKQFRVDRPFMFALYNQDMKMPLFGGHVKKLE